MAKRNSRTASSKSSGRGIVGKVLAVFIALVLLCGAAFGIGWGITGTPNVTKWGKSDTPVDADNGEDNENQDENQGGNNSGNEAEEDYEGSVITDAENYGIEIYSAVLPRSAYAANGVSEQADSAYTLTAEIDPAYATERLLDWSLAWENSESAFATGKAVSEYATIAPSYDGSDTAVFTCLKDFGEPIVITARSRIKVDAYGTSTVHYYQRLKSVNYSFSYDGASKAISADCHGVYKVDYTGAEKDYTVELVPVYSNYTLEDNYTTTINGALSSAFGYTATGNLTDLAIPAGISGGEPEMSNTLVNWCFYVEWIANYDDGRGRYYNYLTARDMYLSAEDKAHPKYVAYNVVFSKITIIGASTVSLPSNYSSTINSYTPAPYYYYGASVLTFNDFKNAVEDCNAAGVGVIQYTIKIEGEHSSYHHLYRCNYQRISCRVELSFRRECASIIRWQARHFHLVVRVYLV